MAVIVHANENTKKEFMDNPKKFLQNPPYMPKEYRVAIVGQKGAGKKTQAAELAKMYGWKVIDLEKMITQRLEEYKKEKSKAPIEQLKEELADLNDYLEGCYNSEIDDTEINIRFTEGKTIILKGLIENSKN